MAKRGGEARGVEAGDEALDADCDVNGDADDRRDRSADDDIE
jgi:hypothetical protein